MFENYELLFHQLLESKITNHYYQFYYNHHAGDLKEPDFDSFFSKYLGSKILQDIHKQILSFLEYKKFSLYKFFSTSELQLKKVFDNSYKDYLAIKCHEQFFYPDENITPMTADEKKNIYYYLSFVENYYPSYITYFNNLQSDYKKGLFNDQEVTTKTNVVKTFTSNILKEIENFPIYKAMSEIKNASDNAINDYLNKWIETSVTLDEWLKERNIDVFAELKNWDLSVDQMQEIENHQFTLYHQYVKRLYTNIHLHKFNNIPNRTDKETIARRDLALINDLIEGHINEVKELRLKSALSINNWKLITVQFENILRGSFNETDNHNIHSKICFADAEAILSYKNFLENIIASYNKEIKFTPYQTPDVSLPANKSKVENYLYPNFIDFLNTLNPEDKQKSNWSCIGYFGTLKKKFYELETLMMLHHSTVSEPNKQLNIDAHLRHLHSTVGNFIMSAAITSEIFLNENKLTLVELLDKYAVSKKIFYQGLPTNFKLSYIEQYNQGVDYRILDLHSDLFSLISFHFIEKLEDFLKKLPVTEIQSVSPVITKTNTQNLKPQTKEVPLSFYYKKYNSNLSAISDTLNCLKKFNFISEETELKEFRKIFNNTSPTYPICWSGTITELAYFIKYLHNDICVINDLKKDIWKVTAILFINTNNMPYDRQKFRGQKLPAKADLLEKAANFLK